MTKYSQKCLTFCLSDNNFVARQQICVWQEAEVSHVESELTISVFKTLFCENCIPNFHVRAQKK